MGIFSVSIRGQCKKYSAELSVVSPPAVVLVAYTAPHQTHSAAHHPDTRKYLKNYVCIQNYLNIFFYHCKICMI